MFKNLSIIFLALIFSCASPEQQHSEKQEAVIPTTHDTIPEIALWADPLIEDYLNLHLDKLSGSPQGPLTYIKEYGDWEGKNYLTVRIGQSFTDHYATLQWLFIDSTTKQVFEYDIPNDTLIEWIVD